MEFSGILSLLNKIRKAPEVHDENESARQAAWKYMEGFALHDNEQVPIRSFESPLNVVDLKQYDPGTILRLSGLYGKIRLHVFYVLAGKKEDGIPIVFEMIQRPFKSLGRGTYDGYDYEFAKMGDRLPLVQIIDEQISLDDPLLSLHPMTEVFRMRSGPFDEFHLDIMTTGTSQKATKPKEAKTAVSLKLQPSRT